MPLSDALLLDPPMDVYDVWISVRTDGLKGCGSASDPWNGAPRAACALAFESLLRGYGSNPARTVHS
jgi:hypothetical protein